MDHLSAHKKKDVLQALKAGNFEVCFLPRYSPDLSPIEPCWSKIKTDLRSSGARSLERLLEEAGAALDRITPSDARGCFLHWGYVLETDLEAALAQELADERQHGRELAGRLDQLHKRHRADLEALRAELAAERGRPWWRVRWR